MKAPMRVLKDRVLLSEDDRINPSEVLFIPDAFREKGNIVTVVNAGPDCKEVAVGDRVFLHKQSGLRVTLGGQEFVIVREQELLGLVTE